MSRATRPKAMAPNVFAHLHDDMLVKRLECRWRRVLKRSLCAYCGGPGGTIDHIIPKNKVVSRGWFQRIHSLDNYTSACEACNIWKSDHSLLGFMLMRLADARKLMQINAAEIGLY